MSIPLEPRKNRITLLLLGSDLRLPSDGASPLDDVRTDAILVLSICPSEHTAVMLSLPRDMYCPLGPAHGRGRLNTAFQLGSATGYPGGGGMLARDAVQALLEIPIDYYLVVDFAAFHLVMNAIGPITVCPPREIHDDRFPDRNYGVMTVHFDAGCQELDSVRLLQYARVRHTAGYDFGRTERQQEIIRAVRNRLLTPRALWKLVRQLPALWRQVRPHLDTNMPPAKLLYFAVLFASLPRANIYSGVPTVQHGELRNGVTAAQEQVLLPMPGKFRELVQLLFDASPDTVEAKPEATAAPDFAKRVQRAVVSGALAVMLFSLRSWIGLSERVRRVRASGLVRK